MKKKFSMPKTQEFFEQKFVYKAKPEPVWSYLDREMREKALVKPYNEKVGAWLNYLRELKRYNHNEAKRKEAQIMKEIGPSWFAELSSDQKAALKHLKSDIQSDLIEDLPRRTRSCLNDLGCTLKLSKALLMKAMRDSHGDAGVFIWNLYTEYYKSPPSVLQPSYDLDAKLLMSSLVFMDMDECVKTLTDLTKNKKRPSEPKKKKVATKEDKASYNEYLQSTKCTLYSNNPPEDKHNKKDPKKAPPLEYKVKLKSEESYAKLCNDTNFIERRRSRNKKEREIDRPCDFKFWEPPSTLRNKDPSVTAYVNKLKMIKLRPKAKFKAPYENVQYHVGNVAFAGGRPRYLLNNVALLPSGFVPINGGLVCVKGEMVMHVHGYWKFPLDIRDSCDIECDCLDKWSDTVNKFLEKSKCTCGHRYDLYHVGKAKEKYFHPSTRYGQFWIDKAKIFQLDTFEDFIKHTIKDSLLSKEVTPEPSEPSIAPTGLKEKALVEAFLSEVADTPLIIPHLPEANLLTGLQEWVRRRVKGPVSDAVKKKQLLKSQRRWLDLKHKKCIALPCRIPFTSKQLENLTWDHRFLMRDLTRLCWDDFVDRNRNCILHHTQMWWSTMRSASAGSKGFGKIFFSYMPARKRDIHILNPYCPDQVRRHICKPCPLNL